MPKNHQNDTSEWSRNDSSGPKWAQQVHQRTIAHTKRHQIKMAGLCCCAWGRPLPMLPPINKVQYPLSLSQTCIPIEWFHTGTPIYSFDSLIFVNFSDIFREFMASVVAPLPPMAKAKKLELRSCWRLLSVVWRNSLGCFFLLGEEGMPVFSLSFFFWLSFYSMRLFPLSLRHVKLYFFLILHDDCILPQLSSLGADELCLRCLLVLLNHTIIHESCDSFDYSHELLFTTYLILLLWYILFFVSGPPKTKFFPL